MGTMPWSVALPTLGGRWMLTLQLITREKLLGIRPRYIVRVDEARDGAQRQE